MVRGLRYYWRTNAAVVAGVATAVAVLAGALLVGDSVRGSLRNIVLERLGRTDQLVASAGFFREALAEDLRGNPRFSSAFEDVSPLIVAQGFATVQGGEGRAGQVRVYGVDDRFWKFHDIRSVQGPGNRDAFLSPALAAEIGADAGDAILVRVQRPSDVPLESLHGDKDDLGRTVRAIVRDVLNRESLGEFSLEAQQGPVRAVFLPLRRMQQEMEVPGRVNALIAKQKIDGGAALDDLNRLVREEVELEDLGLRLRASDARGVIIVESEGGLIDEELAAAAKHAASGLNLDVQPVFTYLANTLRSGEREIPYSLVSAVDFDSKFPAAAAGQASGPTPVILTDWAARDLKAADGARLTMDYYVWEDPGRLVTQSAEFVVAGVVPVNAADQDLAPVYPGITESPTLDDWDPPFSIDLRRVRPIDEEYWERYRTAPKAFIPIEAGQQLWQSRYGKLTSLRLSPGGGRAPSETLSDYQKRLRATIDPLSAGLAVQDVRSESVRASRGATDFGQYFVYFSFFLVASALLLAGLFFKLSIEHRGREVGLLRAVGFNDSALRRLYLGEGLILSLVGGALGLGGALGYAAALIAGLRTWWVGAVGTTALTLHVTPASLLGGAIGGVAAAAACVWLTLRGMAGLSERGLLAGRVTPDATGAAAGRRKRLAVAAVALALLGAALVAAGAMEAADAAAAFFGAGAALLAACLCALAYVFRSPSRWTIEGRGRVPAIHLGLRSVSHRPSRSIVSVATIAFAAFILISVDAFRKDEAAGAAGVGGYSLLVSTQLPLVHDPSGEEGRDALGLTGVANARIEPFRVRPGDDTSCLNLYEPRNPRIMAPPAGFIQAGRFNFRSALAGTDRERANPWTLLDRIEPDGAIPVIADANSMTYVLHRKLGDDIVIEHDARPIRLRLVAALDDSIFQGELLMSPGNFVKLFPDQEGYRFLLVETAPGDEARAAAEIESALADFGADAVVASERLSEFHRVENTYLSTFQMLGGLGLLLGTVGLAAVLLRNVLERRKELALLRAVGYRPPHFFVMAIAENAALLLGGLACGAACAALAIAPVIFDRGGRLPAPSLGLILIAVLASGLITSLVATIAALRAPLLEALRSE